jgi:hypothetical protein
MVSFREHANKEIFLLIMLSKEEFLDHHTFQLLKDDLYHGIGHLLKGITAETTGNTIATMLFFMDRTVVSLTMYIKKLCK